MIYKIIFSDRALDQLKRMEKNVQESIIAVLERIRVRPEALNVSNYFRTGYT